MAKPARPTIPYAHPALQHGVMVEQRADGTYVSVPPPAGLRVLLRVEWLLLVFLGFRVWGAIDNGKMPLLSGPLFPVVLGWLLYITWRRRIFVVTGDEVRMGYARGSSYIWESRWPRDSIGEIKVNPFSGKLLIRISGQDMKEYSIGRDPKVAEYVAESLQRAVAEPIGGDGSAVEAGSRREYA